MKTGECVMKHAVITGANGFIGSALCKELTSHGIYVTAVVRNLKSDVSRLARLSGLQIEYCDMQDIGSLPGRIDGKPDVFYHFAWEGCSGVLRGSTDVQIQNIKNTCEAVKAAAVLECKKFIYAASIMEYETDYASQSGRCPQINTVYCMAKRAAGYMAHAAAGQYGISYIEGLITNIYGPGETSPRLINSSIRKLLDKKPTVFTSGNQMYDFIYISDAARYFHAIGEKGMKDSTYYIGSGVPKPLKEFLCEMGETVSPGTELGIGKISFDGNGTDYQRFDMEKTERDLGVYARIPFKEGIQKTAEWIVGEGMSDGII